VLSVEGQDLCQDMERDRQDAPSHAVAEVLGHGELDLALAGGRSDNDRRGDPVGILEDVLAELAGAPAIDATIALNRVVRIGALRNELRELRDRQREVVHDAATLGVARRR
jgi:hypothetical protein